MAAILHGPRLGAPSATGFKVWVRTDGAATFILQTRLTGTTAWTTQDTQAIETSKDNTVVLTATGLEGATEYDYQILEGAVVKHPTSGTISTMTMPHFGQFVMYAISDAHGGDNQAAYDWARTDWETNYEGSNVPGLILSLGDLYQMAAANDTERKVLDDIALPEIAEISGTDRACERLPLIFMWDDWDFAGNNSSKARQLAFGAEADAYVAALNIWDYLWREAPQPDSPSKSYVLEIAGIPIILADQRSQRTHPISGNRIYQDGVNGDEGLTDNISAFGSAHRQWFIDTLRLYGDRGLVLFVNGTTIRGNQGNTTAPGAASRDSIGVYFEPERNYIFREGAIQAGYAHRKNLVFITGDDHRNTVWHQDLTVPGRYDDATIRAGIGLPNREFKVISGTSAVVGQSDSAFGVGNRFEWSGSNFDCVLRVEVTSKNVGRWASARFTYYHISGTQDPPGAGGIPTDDDGRLGDFYYENGYFNTYDATSTEQAQLYPPENGVGGVQFRRSFLEHVGGTLRRDVARDYRGTLASYEEDMWDAPSRDEFKETLEPHREEAPTRTLDE